MTGDIKQRIARQPLPGPHPRTALRVGAKFRWDGALAFFLAAAPVLAFAQSIVPDGRTATSLATQGNVTSVSTATLSGANAFNSFSRFGVDAGAVVNLHVPGAASNLINIVRDERTNVYGILNSIKDGRIGGNVWFANPHGFVVGASGIVNVGSLTVATPTQAFVDGFFTAPGSPNEAAAAQLLAGTAPRNTAGLVSIQGTINAADDVRLLAGTVNVGGTLYSGARFLGAAPDFSDVVNANGLASAGNVVVKEGRIAIVADNDVAVAGTLAAPGGPGVKGGTIDIRAGGDIDVQSGALLGARGNGENSPGGTVYIWADNDAVIRQGALIDASAGTSGDGGFIEFSAKRLVELAGGEFRASAPAGRLGTVLIDPETVTVSADFYTGGAHHVIQADESITVNGGITVSTRNVVGGAGADQQAAASQGNSGNLTLQAPSIELLSGSRLLAHADSGFEGGDIRLEATRSGGELAVFSDSAARIALTGATVRGRNIAFTASSSHTSSISPIVTKTVSAVIDVDSSTIDASGNIVMNASAAVNSSTPNILPLGTIDVTSEASVTVRGASSVSAGGSATLSAASTVTAKALPGLPDFVDLPGDAGVAVVIVDSKATVDIDGTTTASVAGTLGLAATNTVNVEAKTDASASGSTAVGGAVSVAVVDTPTRAAIGGAAEVTQAGSIDLSAVSVNAIVVSAKAAAGGAKEKQASEAPSKTEETLADYQDDASTSDGGVTVAAAVAVADLDSTTQAYLDAAGGITSSGAVTVSSEALNQSEVTADGSSSEGGVGVGVGVALNLARLTNEAYVAQTVSAHGLTVSALMAGAGEANAFITSATSGAAASNVGVAGALAVNTLENRTRALVKGNADVNAGGSVVLTSVNESESTAEASPADGGTSGDSFGLGASVALNVITNESRSEVQNGGQISNANDVTLSAAGSHATTTTAEAGAAGGIALTPVAAIAVVDNSTTARLGTGALTLAGTLSVGAAHAGTTTTSATADAAGDKVAVGASVAVNVVSDIALATTARTVNSTGGAVTFAAASSSTTSAAAKASAKGGKEEDENSQADGVDQEVGKQKNAGTSKQADGSNNAGQEASSAETSEGKVSVAGAVAVNVAASKAEAYVPDGGSVTAGGGALTVSATNNTDAKATADGSAADSGSQVGIGVAVGINTVTATSHAYIGSNASVTAQGVNVTTGMTDVAGDGSDLVNTFEAEAKSGGGGGKVGIAGSLALNVINVSSTAEIKSNAGVAAGGGDVSVAAGSASATIAKATPHDGGGQGDKVGVGASVALNLFTQDRTTAAVRQNAGIGGARDLEVRATSDSDTTAEAEAGASGSVALDAVVALTEVKQTTEALVASGSQIVATGAVQISATATGDHKATATGDVKSTKVGIGASAAIILSNTTTTASLERDLTTTGSLDIAASGTRSYEAVAKASAGGGKDEDQSSQEEKDKAKSTSTLADNQDSQKGTEKTKSGSKVNVAAAAGVLVLDDDVTASIAADRTIGAGGELSVTAFNGSDFSARGLGDAIDITKLTSGAQVGIGVGVGLAIVRNDTAATIGSGTHILDAGDITVAAESKQNTSAGFKNKLAAEGVAGAGSEKVSVAGALAVATSNATTRASIGDGVTIDQAGAVAIEADNTSKLSAKAWSAATSGKVGIGASIAIVVSENEYQASLGDGADVTATSLAVAARNHKVSGTAPFDFSLSDVKDLGGDDSKLTELNLQGLLGENNYYTEAIAGAGGGNVAVTGAFAVNVFDDKTEAWVGLNADVTTTGAVSLTAASDTTAKAFAGGVSVAGKVGVGLASADIVNSGQTRAYLAGGAQIHQAGSVGIDASAALDLMVISASAAAAGTAGVGGVLSLILSDNIVEAYADDNTLISSGGALAIGATNTFEALNVAGVAGIGGTAGVGASSGINLVDNETRAWIGSNATVDAAGLTSVDASSSQDVLSVVVSGSGGGTAGVSASAAVNVYNPVTQAWIGAGADVNTNGPIGTRSVRVSADSTTDLLSVVGTVGIGGNAGVGGGADVAVIDKTTQAWIAGGGSDVRAGDNLLVLADSAETVRSVAVGVGGGGTVGVQGSASVLVLSTDTQAYAADGAKLHAQGNVVIAADGVSELDLLAGAIGAAGTVAVGAGAAVAVVDKKTHAWIGDGAEATALGNRGTVEVASGSYGIGYVAQAAGEGEVAAPNVDPSTGSNAIPAGSGSEALSKKRTASRDTREIRGLAVTATSKDDIESFAVTGGASGTVAVTLSGDVNVFTSDTQAWIGDGAKVNENNAGAGAQQSVLVTAGSDFYHLGIAGALAASGTVGVGVGADVSVVNLKTKAGIGDGALVNAGRNVEVDARATQELVSISASLGASGVVAVSGSVSVLSLGTETWAWIGDGATVDANGNVAVRAQDDTDSTMVAGTAAIGIGAGGVGGAVGVISLDKDTRAWVGNDATVDARGNGAGNDFTAYTGDSFGGTTAMRGLLVQAQSREDLFMVGAAGAGGQFAGVAGAVTVQTIDADTTAYIGDRARVNTGGGAANANQDVNVTARNDLKMFTVDGSLGIGPLGAGIAGSVDVGVVRNDTVAFIGDSAAVNAQRDVDVSALANKDIETYVISAAGGIVGLAAGVAVYSVGGALGGDSQDRLKTDDGRDTGSFADSQATDGSITEHFLDGYSDTRIQGAAAKADAARTGTTVSGKLTGAESRPLPAGTAAFIGKNAIVNAGRHVDVDARETLDFDMLTGALAVGVVGLGAGVGVAEFQNDTRAYIENGAHITAGAAGDLTVHASLLETLGVLSIAGSGGVVAVDAAVAILGDGSNVVASLGDDVTVDRANAVRVAADDERTLEAETTGVSVGAVAAGASVAIAEIGGTTRATIGSGALIGQGAQNVNGVVVSADADHAAKAEALAAKGGLGLAASGTVSTATIDPTVTASIGANGTITVQDNLEVDAVARVAARAEATGINVSLGAGVGASIAEAKVSPQVNATLGANTAIEAGGLQVSARQLVPGVGQSAYASATGAAGGLLLGANATSSSAGNTGQVRALVGDGSTLTVSGATTVLARNDTSQFADVSGLSIGIVALGANEADAGSNTLTRATLGDNVNIAGGINGSVTILAMGTDRNIATAVSGSGGVVSGSAASANTAALSDTLAAIGASACGAPAPDCGIAAGSFALLAQHDTIYNAKVDSTSAAVAGASGANTNHNVHSVVNAAVGSGAKVTANDIAIAADNASRKFWWGAGTDDNSVAAADNAAWNVDSGSGGLINLPAGKTVAQIRHVTQVNLGAASLFHVLMPALGTGSFTLDANNTIVAYDKARLDSGGAIALAESNSILNVVQNSANVTIGADAAVVSDSGDINIGSRTSVKLDARATANTYGLAGAPSGAAHVNYHGDSTTLLGSGALLLANDPTRGAINIGAGRNSLQQPGSIVASTAVNLWNKTAFPINSTPDALTNVTQQATVTMAPGSNVLAAGDVGLAADRGAISVSAVGIGKDLYREAAAALAGAIGIDASFDITGGSAPAPGGQGVVAVNGTVLSGLLRQSATQIDVEILNPSSDPDVVPTWRLVYSQADSRDHPGLSANPLDASEANPYITWVAPPQVSEADVAPDSQLQARIDLLYSLKLQYASDPVASAAYNAEINFLLNKLGPQGIGQNSSAITARGSAAFDAAGAVGDALLQHQALITGNIDGETPAAQKGAVGSLIDAYLSIDANNTVINTALTGMLNADTTQATYTALTANRSTAASSYTDLRDHTSDIGNYGFACDTGLAGCAAPGGPLGTLASSTQDGFLIVQGAGYLGAIQDGMRNISLLALKQPGASGTLVSNVTGLSTQMNNVKLANDGIVGAAQTIHGNLSQAATRQATLSTNWRDTATEDNVDLGRVATVVARTGLNAPLITSFNDASSGSAASTIKTNADAVAAAASAAAASIATVNAASDTTVPGSQKLITLPDIAVKLGNVNVKADVLAGTGAVQAPGDAKIWIINNAPTSMNIGNLVVDSSGGNVRLNGFLVNDADDVRRFNPSYAGPVPTIVSRENGAAGAPEIRIVSNYDPSAYSASATDPARQVPAAAPDITLGYRATPNEPTKHISNPNGGVFVTSAAGDIYVDGSITAGSVSILARNGDFVQQYVNGFNAVAGEPNGNVQGGPGVLPPNTNAAPGAGIVANGNIFISARYLNINGLVQSGIVNYHLDIPDDTSLRFVLPQNLWSTYIAQCGNVACTLSLSNGRSVTYDPAWISLDGGVGRVVANKAFIDQSVGQPVDVAVTTNGTRDYGAIAATYDPAAQKIVMTSNVAVRGGSIQLFGQIINTASGAGAAGTGKLAVLDGFGQIAVNNQSSLPIELKSIDTGVDPDAANPGRGTVGTIEITDVQYIGAAGDQNLYAIHTLISRDQDAITVDQTGQWLANGSFCPSCTTTSYAVDQNSASRVTVSDARTGAYNPQAGLRYVFTTGKKTSTEYTWTFKGNSFFGTSSLSLPPDNVSKTLTSGPNVLSNVNLANGTYLSYLAPAGVTPHQNNLAKDAAVDPAVNGGVTVGSTTPVRSLGKSYQTSSVYHKVKEWNDCNWWTLCIASRYTSIWTQTTGTTTITTNSVKADYPIQVEFMGANTAGLTVTSPNAAVTLASESTLQNRYGDTSISTTALNAGASSLIVSRDVALSASNGSLGAVGAPVNLLMSGTLTANAVNGSVVANQIAGPLKVAAISASGNPALGQGKVLLSAQDDIYGDAGNLISAARVELTSATGAIGGIAGAAGAHAPLNVAPGYTADRSQQQHYGLKAAAAGDIGIDVQASAGNPDGHLLADTIVSAGGDVRLTAPGQILDNNPDQSIDTRVWNELLNYWDSLGLVAGSAQNEAKVGQAINVYENTRGQDYFEYWLIRDGQNAPAAFDPAWRYQASAAEVKALTAANHDVAAFEQSRTDRYWVLDTAIAGFDPLVYARSAAAAQIRAQNPTWTQAQVNAQVLSNEQQGLLPAAGPSTAYDPGFTYVASQAEREPYLSTGSWTTPQLALSLNPGLLKDITDTNPVVKAPNVAGRNVTLVAGTSFGTTLPSTDPAAVFIPYNTDGNISDAAKIALATAEFSDFKLDVMQGGVLGLRVDQRLPFNFDATTGLSASVREGGVSTNGLTPHVANTDTGNAYLASLGSGIIGYLGVDGELRLKVKGPIFAVDPAQVAIRAGDLVLEAAGATIGGDAAATDPLRVEVAQGVNQTADSFGSLTARAAGLINISGAGSVNVGGIFSRDAITLASESGSILDAHPGTGLDVLGGTIQLLAPLGSIGDINANRPLSVGTNIGTPLSGLIEAAAGQSVYLNGPFGGPVSSNFTLGPVVPGHDAVSAGDAIRITATNDATINGNVVAPGPIAMAVGGTLTLSGERDIAVADPGAPGGIGTVTAPAAHVHATGVGVLIDAGMLVMEDGARVQVDVGTIRIVTDGDMRVTGIETGNDGIDFMNGAESSIYLESLTGSIYDAGDTLLDIIADTAPAAKLVMKAAGQIGGNPLDVRLLNLETVSGGLTHIDVQDSVHVESMQAGGEVVLNAGVAGAGSITGGTVASTGANVNLAAPDSIVLTGIQAATAVNLGADVIDTSVLHTGTGFLAASVGGGAGGPASLVNLSVSSPTGVAFGGFSVLDGALLVPSGDLQIDQGFVANRLTIANPVTFLLLDQNDRSPQPSDIQVYAPNQPFGLDLSGRTMSTDATVIHYHELTHTALSDDPGADPDLRHNLERGLSLAGRPEAEGAGDLAKGAGEIGYDGIPVALPDCNAEPVPDACK